MGMTASTPSPFHLADRAVIRLSGEDVRGFLDGLVTSSVLGDLPVYAALLTPQGKVIADFFVWADSEGDRDDLLLDVHADDADALIRRLSMYRLRRPITISRDEALAVHWSPIAGNDHASPNWAPARSILPELVSGRGTIRRMVEGQRPTTSPTASPSESPKAPN